MLVSRLYLPVKKALDWLSAFAPARMSGTGASIFAAFDTEEEARRVMALIPAQAPVPLSAFVARGVNLSPAHTALEKLK
jgi:4-diphosphocytidyl-2-C-methyl-D-erythritol kinase